jgi:shikimate dehydrogenase
MTDLSQPVKVGANTRYIISTSGRPTSLRRYQLLLQELLKLDIAYIPINSGDISSPQISPERFAWALRGMPCIGGAISRDIKHAIIPFLDEIDEEARMIDSVNTVIVQGSKLIGYNTDAKGFEIAIVNGISNRSISSAICYGYGGVVSVVVHILKKLGISKIYICGRRLEEAAKRAESLGVAVWTAGVTADLFINAAPVTDKPLEDSLNFVEALGGSKVAFDHEMPGLKLKDYCLANGIHHISGFDMYYPQMISQWKLFLGDTCEEEELAALIRTADAMLKSK